MCRSRPIGVLNTKWLALSADKCRPTITTDKKLRKSYCSVIVLYIVKHDRLTLVGLHSNNYTEQSNYAVTRSTIDSHLDRSVNSDSVKFEFNV